MNFRCVKRERMTEIQTINIITIEQIFRKKERKTERSDEEAKERKKDCMKERKTLNINAIEQTWGKKERMKEERRKI